MYSSFIQTFIWILRSTRSDTSSHNNCPREILTESHWLFLHKLHITWDKIKRFQRSAVDGEFEYLIYRFRLVVLWNTSQRPHGWNFFRELLKVLTEYAKYWMFITRWSISFECKKINVFKSKVSLFNSSSSFSKTLNDHSNIFNAAPHFDKNESWQTHFLTGLRWPRLVWKKPKRNDYRFIHKFLLSISFHYRL